MSQDIQKLQNEVIILKSRIFDFSEAVQERDNQLNAHRSILGEICKLLSIDGSEGIDGQVVVAAVAALVSPVTDDSDCKFQED